jgi:glycosyltransferase involved in cell wall biosynthesis
VLGLARGLMRAGHDVLVVCPPGSELERACREDGVPAAGVSMRSELDPVSVVRLAAILRRFGADVAHYHTARAHTLGLAASHIAGTPVKVLSRRVDFPVAGNPLSKLKYKASVDAVIAITEAVRDVLARGGVDPSVITVIYSGIDLAKRAVRADGAGLRAELGIPREARLVGVIGALAPHKAQAFLLKAAAKLAEERDDVRYIIAGEGELERELKELALLLKVTSIVTFAGFRRDMEAVLGAIDLFVLSSVAEGLCTSILDAMASGVPVVATRVGGVPEVVVDGESGLLVPPADEGALASAIARALDDGDLRRRLVEGGRLRVKRFSLERTVAETESLYARLLRSKKGERN